MRCTSSCCRRMRPFCGSRGCWRAPTQAATRTCTETNGTASAGVPHTAQPFTKNPWVARSCRTQPMSQKLCHAAGDVLQYCCFLPSCLSYVHPQDVSRKLCAQSCLTLLDQPRPLPADLDDECLDGTFHRKCLELGGLCALAGFACSSLVQQRFAAARLLAIAQLFCNTATHTAILQGSHLQNLTTSN